MISDKLSRSYINKFLLHLGAFHFDDLRVIDLSGCESITDTGFQALASQNRHIEKLIANACFSLTDIGKIVIFVS